MQRYLNEVQKLKNRKEKLTTKQVTFYSSIENSLKFIAEKYETNFDTLINVCLMLPILAALENFNRDELKANNIYFLQDD